MSLISQNYYYKEINHDFSLERNSRFSHSNSHLIVRIKNT